MDHRPSFFQVIWPEINSEKMRIPLAYGSQMRALANDVVILRDRYTNTWQVAISRIGHDWYFDNSWAKFYKENSLEWGDFLVFEYKGNNLFDFKLLGETACEKKGVGYLCFKVKEEEMDEEDKEEEDEDEQEEEDEDEVGEEEEEDEDEDGEGEEDEDEEEETSEEDIELSSRSMSLPFGKIKFNIGNKRGVTTTKSRRKQNIAPHCYGAEIFESGLVPRPKNPFFVSRSRKEKRKNELLIPKNVIEDYNLNLREIMFLVDRKGNKWETKIKRWRDGRVCLTRGWRGLCTMNDIKRDDVCVCEFVQRNDDEGRDILVYAVDTLDK